MRCGLVLVRHGGFFFLLFVAAFSFCGAPLRSIELPTGDADTLCSQLLGGNASTGMELALGASEARTQAQAENHSLIEFFGVDGPASQYPLMAMSAAQRTKALILHRGTVEVADPFAEAGKRTKYSLISDGVPETGGRRIIRQYPAVEAVVRQISAQAEGHRMGNYAPTLVGNPGTGKSEFIIILRSAFMHLPLYDSKYFVYTFEWVGLNEIPSLSEVYPGGAPIHSQMNESPLALLAEPLQQAYMEAMGEKVGGRSWAIPRTLNSVLIRQTNTLR